MTEKIESLGRVVGRNVRRRRAEQGASLEEVSQTARNLGLSWSASRVNAIQRGARDPKLSTLLSLATVLDCRVADLLQTSAGWIDLGEVSVPADLLAAMFDVNTPPLEPSNPISLDEWVAFCGYPNEEAMTTTLGVPAATLREMNQRCGLTETRTARALGMDPDVLNAITWGLFDGRTLGEERDRIAAEQHRNPGDVTTELRAQIAAHVAGWPYQRLNPIPPPDDQD